MQYAPTFFGKRNPKNPINPKNPSSDKKVPHNCFLNLATGMSNCSRYLATVRRAML